MSNFARPATSRRRSAGDRRAVADTGHVWTAPAVQEENRTVPRIVRVQPCIRPLNAAVLAAGPDVIR